MVEHKTSFDQHLVKRWQIFLEGSIAVDLQCIYRYLLKTSLNGDLLLSLTLKEF